MLYIHKLSDLNPKSAEIESVAFVRALKLGGGLPLTQQRVGQFFAETLISEADIAVIEQSLARLEPTLAKLNALLAMNDPVYEPVDIRRTIQSISSLAGPLAKSFDYASAMLPLQREFIAGAAALLNSVPALKTPEEKSSVNAQISAYFEKVLRSNGLTFTHLDLVHEAQTGIVRDFAESFRNGYLFHVTLEEELKKATFADIKLRIPPEKLREAEEIGAAISQIKQGVDVAYSLNMRMVLWAVLFYSCIKLATAK